MSEKRLAERVAAVERALVDDEVTVEGLDELATIERQIEDLQAHLEDLDDRVAELEAASQALRGYVGGVRAVNDDVERRADAALAKVESLERRFEREPVLTIERPNLTDVEQERRQTDDGATPDDETDSEGSKPTGLDDEMQGLAGRLRNVL